MTSFPEPIGYSEKEMAVLLGRMVYGADANRPLSKAQMQRLRYGGQGPPFKKIGRFVSYPAAAFATWIAECTPAATSTAEPVTPAFVRPPPPEPPRAWKPPRANRHRNAKAAKASAPFDLQSDGPRRQYDLAGLPPSLRRRIESHGNGT